LVLLFIIYINDLERNIKSNIKFFADDTILLSIVKDPVISANDLHHDLDMTMSVGQPMEMEFNPHPTKQATEVLFPCTFLPLKRHDQMYKALVRSHLDYCDIIYHIQSIIHQPPLRRALNSLMEKAESNIKQLLQLLVLGKVQVVPQCMMN
jgi:hypothetical protein